MELKDIFTSYWSFLPLCAACKLNLFDAVGSEEIEIDALSELLKLNKGSLRRFLKALAQIGVATVENGRVKLTQQGLQLTETHPKSLKFACINWGGCHLTAWRNMELSLKTGRAAFEDLYGESFFSYLASNADEAELYHKAMDEYARDDYAEICRIVDFSGHNKIIDVGGGLGALISAIFRAFPQKECVLFDRPEIIKLSKRAGIQKIGGDFFDKIPEGFDAVVLSRVLHDWNDRDASRILANVRDSLENSGKLYVIENLSDKIPDNAALLSLNMLIMTKSFERTKEEFKLLLRKAQFEIYDVKQINRLQYCMIYQKISS